MKNWIRSGCAGLLVIAAATPAAGDYPALKKQAEALIAEGSYARAHALYIEAMELSSFSSNEARWVAFRSADTQWRAAAATQSADTTRLDEARTALERMVRDVQRSEEQDRVWVEIQESLGDFWWTSRHQQNWGQAWPYYERALDWWAGQSDLALARQRYLSLVWRCARPPRVEPYYRYGYFGNYMPLPILQNALGIAQSDDDRAHAHYLIATTLQSQGGSWQQLERVADEFEAAIALGRKTDWMDDALYNYAQWMEQRGRFVPMEGGGYRNEPDYVKALELYRQLVKELGKGETRYFDPARQQIKAITGVQLGVSVANIFLPDSEIQFQLTWRNVRRVDLALYPVDLARDVNLNNLDDQRRQDWLQSIDLAGRETVKVWSFDTQDQGAHQPGNESVRLDEKLKPGAYVLSATAGGEKARDLVLVSDAALVLKTSGKQALVYVCDALSGAPLADSEVTLWASWNENRRWQSLKSGKKTDPDGLAVFDLPGEARHTVLFVGARHGERQAFSAGQSRASRSTWQDWKIYAFTDRPAYRPQETVQWKFTARRYNGSVYSTPASERVEFEITDPRGSKVQSDKVSLNSFGSAWGTLDLADEMPLGEYRIVFWDEDRRQQIGQAALFRLEEYKLPEFKVAVSTPQEKGADGTARPRTFRLGDTVEATITAEYYFGGPVSDADVEVVVYQNPFWIGWPQPREFPWLYSDLDEGAQRWRRSYGAGPIVKRETLKTDANGQAIIRFDTPADEGQDYEYRIEARVTDSSRREIVNTGTVRVTRQRYYVNARAQHNLYQPHDQVRVEFQAQDANRNPVEVEGTVKVTRQYWWEIWIKPDGTEVKGDELKRLQARHPIWPPPPERPDQKGWKLKFRGYEQDELFTRTVKTDTNGMALFSFEPDRVGYYQVSWTSEDRSRNTQYPAQITAETTVWVTDSQSTDIGYRHGGVEIIADKDTFRVGNEAPVMLVANSADRYVLFTVEGRDLQSYRVVHLTGTVKLLHLPIEEQHVPNIFLGATMVSDREIFTDTQQVVVPPTRNFLTVEVTPDRDSYQPREEGTLTVTTRDDEGRPVSAEVALSLVDESVFYIQGDYAGDPRQFFFGSKRPNQIETQSTMNQKRYVKLIEVEDGGVRDQRELESAEGGGDGYEEFPEHGSMPRAQGMVTALSGRRLSLEAALPQPSGMPMLAKMAIADESQEQLGASLDAAEPPPGAPESAVVVRSDFRSTILWQPDLKTGRDGTATVKVTYPDSVTSWKATARAATDGNQFGMADAATRTKQPLIVRLQAPRFFVVGDEVVLSAVVNNNTEEALNVKVTLDIVGGLKPAPAAGSGASQQWPARLLRVPAKGQARADWKTRVTHPGDVTLQVTARGGSHSDAMKKAYPVFEHGIEKFISKSGKVRGDDITVTLDLPRERTPDSTTLTVQVTPSMAVTMLDALPYLIDYPYGCTEQTMSRFLPAVITAKTLKDLGMNSEDVMGRVFGGIEPQHTAATQPQGRQDLAKLSDMTQTGLDRLYDFQHGDGGWGWWKEGESDHWMTSYVVWGLSLARDAKVRVKEDVLSRARDYLAEEIVEEEENPDMQAFMLHALGAYYAPYADQLTSTSVPKALDNLWTKRDALNAYTRALLALSAHYFHREDQARILVENLENGVLRDDRPDTSVLVNPATRNPQSTAYILGTAHWGEDVIYWRWSDGGVEATAFALRALLAIDPKNPLVEPVANWLIKNRRGAQWSNTRDTAIVVLALNDYLRVSGELQSDIEFEVFVNGNSIAKRKIGGADVLKAPSRFIVDPKLVQDGANRVRIRRQGEGPVYFAAEATYFSLEEPIPAAGNEIFVKRQYFKWVGRPTLLKGYVYDRVPLLDGDSVASGDRVETVLTVEAKNNYEYLVFEDLKPAGFEAVELRSGQSLHAHQLKSGAASTKPEVRTPDSGLDHTGRSRWVYQELRDRKVALFLDQLPEGVWEMRYDCRAEVPGTFHALPVLGHAMYVPEIRCNGDELRVTVVDAD